MKNSDTPLSIPNEACSSLGRLEQAWAGLGRPEQGLRRTGQGLSRTEQDRAGPEHDWASLGRA